MGYPTVFPTGVTLYRPEKAWSGYTLLQAADVGALLIDPHGREVKLWNGLQGFPNKLLPGGSVLGSTGQRDTRVASQDQLDLVQVDWDGKVTWKFDRLEEVTDPGAERRWVARQHHDYQREGNPVGYYVPGQDPRTDGGKTLVLVHENVTNPAISDHPLLDDRIVEVDWEGNILWDWHPHDHFDELDFDEAAKATLRRNPNLLPSGGGVGDWLHINSASWVGPNKWYDAGDERFHPDNVIWDAREANIIAIVSKATGKIVWKLGPHYDGTDAEKKIGWIIGQHHAHIVPKGLPGEGDVLVFDNGGWAGYGEPNPESKDGTKNALRDYSRVLEIDPVTLEVVWQYTPKEAGYVQPLDATRFYSPFISSAQRLPNGNTLITEGSDGRVFEVTREHELVWEYISPYWGSGHLSLNLVYRAYRYPYSWVPQVTPAPETEIVPLDKRTFRVPGAAPLGRDSVVEVEGVKPRTYDPDFCVIAQSAS